MPIAEQCGDFLVSVVNAEDRHTALAVRNRFRKLYRDWFSDEVIEGEALRVLLAAWKAQPAMWWMRQDSFTNENPTDYFEWSVAVLRDKLRFIWTSDPEQARYGMRLLFRDVYGFRRYGPEIEPGRAKAIEACKWLEKWLTNRKGSKLVICKNPECADTKYFIRGAKEPNQKYCSPVCSERGEELIRLERQSKREAKRVLSPEAKEAIRDAQRKRRSKEKSAPKKSTNPKAGRVKGG
jgi:hypothetical protein